MCRGGGYFNLLLLFPEILLIRPLRRERNVFSLAAIFFFSFPRTSEPADAVKRAAEDFEPDSRLDSMNASLMKPSSRLSLFISFSFKF